MPFDTKTKEVFSLVKENIKFEPVVAIVNFANYFLGTEYGYLDYDYKPIEIGVISSKKLEDKKTKKEIINIISDKVVYLKNKSEHVVSFNKLECLSYVEIVLAMYLTSRFYNKRIKFIGDKDRFSPGLIEIFVQKLTNEELFATFNSYLVKLRYKNSKTNFTNRNHFMSIDWLKNNKDVLQCITTSLNLPIKIASCKIDKANWLLKHEALGLNLAKTAISEDDLEPLAQSIISADPEYKPQTSITAYVDINDVLDNYDEFAATLPKASIVVIVRPNWNIKKTIGTNINISHLGFCFKEDNKLVFYHATSENSKMVTKLELKDYLTDMLSKPSVGGIQVLKIKNM